MRYSEDEVIANQYELGLRDYVRILRRRVWVIVFMALAVFAMVYLWSGTLIPVYRSSASIEVTKAVATAGMESWLYYKGHPIETAIRQIKSRACIEAALREMGELTDEMPESEIGAKVSELQGSVSISNDPNTNIITVAVNGANRYKLQAYVNAVCRSYQRLEREWDRRDDDEVITFLEERIAQYKQRLENAEARMIAMRSSSLTHGFGEDLAGQIRMRSELAVRVAVLQDQIAEIKTSRGVGNSEQAPELVSLMHQRDEAESKRQAVLERFMDNHPEAVRYADEVQRLDRVIESRRGEIQEQYRTQVAGALAQKERELITLRQQLGELESVIAQLPQDQVMRANMEMELELSRKLYSMFWERIEQQKIVRQSKSGGVNLQGPASAPTKIYPNERAHQSIGLSLGLMLGIAFAFLLETMDTSIRTIEEIEDYIGVKVLGVVPLIVNAPGEKKQATDVSPGTPMVASPGSIVHHHPRDPASEAYRAIASALEFNFFNEGHRALLVASATPQEGKTTSVSNLGIALADSGRRVLLIDCNLRHPGVSVIFSLSGHAGASEVLSGAVPWRVGTYPSSVKNLDIMPTGALPGQPVELIKAGMPGLLREISAVYDSILIDCPPILPVADATILASMTGGVLLVYSQGKAPRDVLIRAKAKLENAKARVVGIFLNKIKPEGELGKNYYYYYYAYSPTKSGKHGATKKS